MARFGTFRFGEETFGDPNGGSPSFPHDVERIPWNFFDGVNSYDLPINPNEASMPSPKRNVSTKATCAGRQVRIEGKPIVPQIEFSGVILYEEEYRAFEAWVNKRQQIRITDDLGMKYWVYLKSFSPQRVKSNTFPWYHTYSVSGVLLDRG